MAYNDIIYEKSERIATVTMNRPDKSNAWTARMGDELREAVLEADRDDSVRAIIVTGAGKNFCGGADMANLSGIASGTQTALPRDHQAQSKAASAEGGLPDSANRYAWPLALRTPTIAAINGACVGMGLTLCLYYDIRIASERARLGLIFTRRGLAIEHGSSWMLPRLVGLGKAIEMAVTGQLLSANEALAAGLVTRVVPHEDLLPSARELAGQIASQCSPLGIAEAKRLVYKHQFTDLASAIRDDDEAVGRMTRSEDFKEGIKAFVEKRAPNFTGR